MEVLCQLTEGHDKLLLIVLVLHRIHGLREQRDFLELHHHLVELLHEVLIPRNNNAGCILTLREECQRVIGAFFEVAVANDNAKGLCFLLNAVCAGIGLQQIMILQVLVHIKDGELLAVKSGQEHIHDDENIKRLCFLSLYSVRDVLVISREGICGEIGSVHLIIVLDNTLQRIAAMLVLALGILILPVGEDTADIQVMFDLLENVVILNKGVNRGHGKNSRILSISGFRLVVLDDVIGDQRHSLIGHIEFAYINRVCESGVIPVEITLHCFYVFDVEAQNIIIEDSVFNQIIVKALTKEHFRCLRDFTLSFAVDFKTRRPREAEKLCLSEMPHNVLVHISELAAVALVDNKDNLLIFVCVHYFLVLRALYGVCHLLHRCDDKLPVLILHLADKDIGAICHVNRASLKLVKLFGCLRIQVFSVNKENDFLDVRICCKDLRCLKGCQRLARAGCVPDIRISICERCLTDQRFYGINLIGTHDHQNLIGII